MDATVQPSENSGPKDDGRRVRFNEEEPAPTDDEREYNPVQEQTQLQQHGPDHQQTYLCGVGMAVPSQEQDPQSPGVYCEACDAPFVLSPGFRGDCILCHWCRRRGLIRGCLRIQNVNYKVWLTADGASDVVSHGGEIFRRGLSLPGLKYKFVQMSHQDNLAAFQLFVEYIGTDRYLEDAASQTSNAHRITLQEGKVDADERGLNVFVQFRVRLTLFRGGANAQGPLINVPLGYFQ
jgi:hypothetical protein